MTRTIPTAHSAKQLEFTGVFTIQGPQIVGGDGGVPEWVHDLFKDHPEIETIAFNFDHNGVVYQRPFDLIEKEEVGNENPCPKCGRFHLTECSGGYQELVKFTKTGQYGCGSDDEDDVYTVEEFKAYVESSAFIDSDGYGHPVKDSKANPDIDIRPSRVDEIPEDATHIVWYNK